MVCFRVKFTFPDTLGWHLTSSYTWQLTHWTWCPAFTQCAILYYHHLLQEIDTSRRTVWCIVAAVIARSFPGKAKPTFHNAIYSTCGQMLVQTIMWWPIFQSQFMLTHMWSCFRFGWNSRWRRTYGVRFGFNTTVPLPNTHKHSGHHHHGLHRAPI